MIVLKNVSKTFTGAKDIHAVKKVSLKIEDGEIFGIVGYSGAGKSTLVRLINQLEKADAGEIEVNGIDIKSLKGKALRNERQKIGMIFQNFNLLWSRTVKENIAFPLEIAKYSKEEIDDRCNELLKMVGLVDKANAYPSELSGGQKQRIGIARALALKPKVLLCDEATSALDPKTTDNILNLLKEINEDQKITIVIITHQMEVVQKICHRIAVMADGKVIETGKTADIFRSPNNPLTKQLIQTADKNDYDDDINALKEKYKDKHLLRLTFDKNSSSEPILSNIASSTNIKFNIVSASIKNMQEGSMGVMYLYVDKDIRKFKSELKKKGVLVEEL